MRIANGMDQIYNEVAMAVADSILNVGYDASIVVDSETFEILYENNKAKELFGDKIKFLCHEVFNTKETPCMDCPIINISGASESKVRYNDILGKTVTWQFSKIKWINGKEWSLPLC